MLNVTTDCKQVLNPPYKFPCVYGNSMTDISAISPIELTIRNSAHEE